MRITRRAFQRLSLAVPGFAPVLAAARAPIPEPHFPDRLHQFVWRNWELANTERMAEVLSCRPRDILDLGAEMGLPRKPVLTADQLRHIYITVIRQNWHLLPDEQIIKLLGWTEEHYRFTLREDDFLDVKLGPKPECPPVVYAAPGAAARARATQIKQFLEKWLGKDLHAPGEPPFDFVRQLSARDSGPAPRTGKAAFDPRYIYPFFALYGDPLLETEVDPLPEGYLEKLARTGINGIWMQALLRNLAPAQTFPEFGARCEERLANLRRITERLARFNMRAFLYLNEPRAMRPEFFKGREQMRGVAERGFHTMCTSVPEVRQWISDSLAHVFSQVPRLGGVFTITASENLTNCHSKFRPESCPRCVRRKPWDVIGEVIQAVHDGVRRSSQSAEVISWDWGWTDDIAKNLIPRLPKGSALLSVSEWSTPIERGGVRSKVGEYSLSVVGPGPRAAAHWALAREAGVRPFAKTQFNNSWEMSAVPYIPVPNLVARHCAGLARAGVTGVQASWTVGGYPSPNLEVAGEFFYDPKAESADVLARVAQRRYGRAAAPAVLEAWSTFSSAFEGFPYSTVPGYVVPMQHGPANLLRAKPTGVPATMILFPQDDMKRWIGPYPPAVARDLFRQVAGRWQPGLAALERALPLVPESQRKASALDLAIAETCYLHFVSTADQIDFYILRDGLRTPESHEKMRAIAARQRDAALRLYRLARQHSVLAYEASNHYYYRPLDLAEAAIAADYLLTHVL